MLFKNAYVGSKEEGSAWKRLFQSQEVTERGKTGGETLTQGF